MRPCRSGRWSVNWIVASPGCVLGATVGSMVVLGACVAVSMVVFFADESPPGLASADELLDIRKGAAAAASCLGRCGDSLDLGYSCQCNTQCGGYGDCCGDYDTYCIADSCAGKCLANYDASLPCQCNTLCPNYGNCCADYVTLCTGSQGPTSAPQNPSDISTLASAIWAADTTRAEVGTDIFVNYGNYISNSNAQTDVSSSRLFTSVAATVLDRPTFKAMAKLFDNYITTQGNTETTTAAELTEEDDFMAAIFNTDVMAQAYRFVNDKGYFSGSLSAYKDFIRGLLFDHYSRKGSGDTSGFEHVFVGEWSSSTSVSGFHNWVQMYLLESSGQANYHGYFRTQQPSLVKFQFTWSGHVKPLTSAMIGASPEFEIALFSTCFLQSPNAVCKVQLNGQNIDIQTYDYKGADVLGSAYFIA